MKSSFIYPSQFLEKIKTSWKNSKLSKVDEVPPLPEDQVIGKLLDVCYHASFKTEENRRIKFQIAFCNKSIVEDEYKEEIPNKVYSIPFSKPRDFTVKELLRLAPATDPSSVFIGVYLEEGQVKIWGLLQIGSSWSKLLQYKSRYGIPPPNVLTISSNVPGELSISRRGFIIINLRHGEVYSPIDILTQSGPIMDFFESGKVHLYREICSRLKVKQYSRKISERIFPIEVYIHCLEEILFNIQKRGHGGSLIIIPDPPHYETSKIKNQFSIKYPCNNFKGSDCILEYLKIAYLKDKIENKIRKAELKNFKELYYENEELNDQIVEWNDAINESAKFMGSLAGVDGAVLITDRLRLIGFGVEIKTNEPQLKKVKVATDSFGNSKKTVPIEDFGTRHRSAFRFCAKNENSVIFVVSQDGGITAVKQHNSEVTIWPNINTIGVALHRENLINNTVI